MERDELREKAFKWWNSKSPETKRLIAEQNKTHITSRQFFRSPEMITRAYLRSKINKDVKS